MLTIGRGAEIQKVRSDRQQLRPLLNHSRFLADKKDTQEVAMAYFKNIENSMDFSRIVEPLWPTELEQIGLYASTGYGSFDANRLPELIEFCETHPKYHIVSFWGPMKFNQLFHWADSYSIAQGSKDPRLAQYNRYTIDEFIEFLSLKFLIRERLAESDELGTVQQLMVQF